MIFNEENEEYALMRCKELWLRRHPTESFENEVDSSLQSESVVKIEDLFNEVRKQRFLYIKFSWPYMNELVYLIASRQRYKGFSYVLQRFTDGYSRIVPSLDIMLMWMTHQVGSISSPLILSLFLLSVAVLFFCLLLIKVLSFNRVTQLFMPRI